MHEDFRFSLTKIGGAAAVVGASRGMRARETVDAIWAYASAPAGANRWFTHACQAGLAFSAAAAAWSPYR
jgi:hypothetical protein